MHPTCSLSCSLCLIAIKISHPYPEVWGAHWAGSSLPPVHDCSLLNMPLFLCVTQKLGSEFQPCWLRHTDNHAFLCSCARCCLRSLQTCSWPTTPAWARNLLEMPILARKTNSYHTPLNTHPDLLNQKLWGWSCNKPSRWFWWSPQIIENHLNISQSFAIKWAIPLLNQ